MTDVSIVGVDLAKQAGASPARSACPMRRPFDDFYDFLIDLRAISSLDKLMAERGSLSGSPGFRLLYSQSYHGPPQKCTGLDQLMLARSPWENEPILIRGLSLTHRVYPPTDEAFAMAGSSAIDGDILVHVSGSGTVNIMYPEGTGFLFPGRPETYHIDVHAWCDKGHRHEAWLTIFYNKQLDNLPEPSPIPSPENDKLAEIARQHPSYQPVPPDPPQTLLNRVLVVTQPIRQPIAKFIRSYRG